MEFIKEHIWFILFFVWGLPLGIYRSRFRKLVYQTNHWSINIKPVFLKELKALFGNVFPENKDYIKFGNFYRFYLLIYSVLFIFYFTLKTETNMQKIEIGSTIPSFTLYDQNGNEFDISKRIGKKNLVIYFYPKDDSPGCTAEACSFRDQFEDFKDADAEIIGISGQSIDSHKEFEQKYHLNYILLSDRGNVVRKLFGVPTNFFGLIPGRVTYIVNKEGKVVYLFNSQTQATKHVEEALRILQGIK